MSAPWTPGLRSATGPDAEPPTWDPSGNHLELGQGQSQTPEKLASRGKLTNGQRVLQSYVPSLRCFPLQQTSLRLRGHWGDLSILLCFYDEIWFMIVQ